MASSMRAPRVREIAEGLVLEIPASPPTPKRTGLPRRVERAHLLRDEEQFGAEAARHLGAGVTRE
jgi:hypothetical protein